MSQGFTLKLDTHELSAGEKVAILTDYPRGASRVEIPGQIDGVPVEFFENDLFCGDLFLEEVVLPAGFDAYVILVFAGCSNLRRVEIPEGLLLIPPYFLMECSSLESVKIPESVCQILWQAFRGSGLKRIYVPENVSSLGESAFADCKALEEVWLPDGLREIMDGAFCGCASLKKLRLPADLDATRPSFAAGCSSLVEVEIPECGRHDSSRKHKGFSLGFYSFMGCTSLEEIVLPSDTRNIGLQAFQGCKKLKKITIPEGLDFIATLAFEGCESLDEIHLPASAKIEQNAFYNCPARVFFGGRPIRPDDYIRSFLEPDMLVLPPQIG